MKKSVFFSFFLACILMSNAWGDCGYSGKSEYRLYWRDDDTVDFVRYDCDNAKETNAQQVPTCSSRCTGTTVAITDYYSLCIHTEDWIPIAGEKGTTKVRIPRSATDDACQISSNRVRLDELQKKCENSHGEWKDNKCTCDSGKGLSPKNSDSMECKCDALKIWDSGQGQCVKNTAEVACRNTGGDWDSSTSTCDCTAAGLAPKEPERKICVCTAGTDYTWQNGQCRNSKGHTQSEVQTANANWQRQQAANRQACEASGGTYSNRKCSCTAEYTTLQGSECVCNSGYKWKINKKDGCEPTDNTLVQQACQAAAAKGQAQWQSYPSPGRCECKENGYILNVDAGECKPNEQRAICQPLMNANKARWDSVTGTCVCSQAGYELVGNACVETAAAATARKDKEMKSAKNKIEDIHSKLKRVQDGFKVSAWKNEEGKFNTARLASDSIAGVVLGTAGGLVTSKIVKKNQVENGFEDIQCTIGGQTVAQWGDDFSVGAQFQEHNPPVGGFFYVLDAEILSIYFMFLLSFRGLTPEPRCMQN